MTRPKKESLLWCLAFLVSSCAGSLSRHPARPSFPIPDVTKPLGADPACPIHPEPVALPNPLPSELSEAFKQVGAALIDMLPKTSASGFYATAVYRDQAVWKYGAGTTNKSEPNSLPDEDTLYRIGSISKLFPTLMLYQLASKGVVDLDDTLHQYAGDFNMKNPFSPGSDGITFRQVSTQLSGLPREAPCVLPCNTTTEEIFSLLSSQSLILPPWTRPSYSNLGFALLGHILAERVIHTNFEDYVEKNILGPLGMTRTGFEITAAIASKMAVGYEPDGSVAPLYSLGWISPAGQMYSSGNDMVRLMTVFLQSVNMSTQGKVLPASFLKEMMSPVFLNNGGQTLFASPFETAFQFSYLVRRKGGNVDGYSALIAVIPELQLGLTVMWNGQADEFAASNAAFDILIPAFVETLGKQQPAVPQPPNAQIYIGNYSVPGTDIKARIMQYNQLLLLLTPFANVYLSGTGQGGFLRVYIPQGTLPCLTGELLAFDGQYVNFTLNAQGEVVQFRLPGIAYAITFEKD